MECKVTLCIYETLGDSCALFALITEQSRDLGLFFA